MGGYSKIGFLRVKVDLTVMGSMEKNKAQKLESDLLEFFKNNEVNVRGKIEHVQIDTLEVNSTNTNLDTSSQ